MIHAHEIPTTLAQTIAERIQQNGPVSFRDFMEMALYEPAIGYYETPLEKTGANGGTEETKWKID